MAKPTAKLICTGSDGQEDLERFAHSSLELSFSSPFYSLAWSGNQPGGRAKINGCAEGD